MKKLKTQIFWPQPINNTSQGWIQSFLSKLTEEWRTMANIVNNGNVSYGLDADKPAPIGSGDFYWATDTQKLYFDPPS